MELIYKGMAGAAYAYYLQPENVPPDAVPANFIIVRKTNSGFFDVLYVGECADLAEHYRSEAGMRLWGKAVGEYLATDIFTHRASADAVERQREVEDLVRKLGPTMNTAEVSA
jgi:hypothetical protein